LAHWRRCDKFAATRRLTLWLWLLLLLLSVIGVIQCAAVLRSSEGSGSSLVTFPACLCEEDIELLVVDTLVAKLASLCVDGGEVLLKGV
jgi:hypothetical protein